MDWINRMNAAVDYIEDNLSGDIDIAAAAGKACCSEYHFMRIFSFIADIPIKEYIRRRRLTLAGLLLQRSTAKVIDIANKYGYTSPNSFTRAFFAMHGVLPSEARDINVRLNLYPRLTFTLSAKAVTELEFRIVQEGETVVFGKSFISERKTAYETIPAFWEKCEETRVTNQIVRAGYGNEKTLLKGVLSDVDDETVSYMICNDMPKGGVSDEFDTLIIPARTWAVFPLVIDYPDNHNIVSIWKRIYTEWFPNRGYEQAPGPRQDRYYWRDDWKMVGEVWVPVIKSGEI